MKGNTVLKTFKPVAFGGKGAGIKRKQGDLFTPTGRFTIVSRGRSKRFQRFFLIDYPNRDYVELALKEGRIRMSTAKNLLQSLSRGELPDQNTTLGGEIGIHGVGRGDPEIHRLLNWTSGCIGLTNDHIEELYPLTFKGMVIEIRE